MARVRGLMEKRVELVDKGFLSPPERAQYVRDLIVAAIQDDIQTDQVNAAAFGWDLICFANEIMNMFALGKEEDDLFRLQYNMNVIIYSTHYLGDSKDNVLMKSPARDEHEKIWKERIERVLKMNSKDEGGESEKDEDLGSGGE